MMPDEDGARGTREPGKASGMTVKRDQDGFLGSEVQGGAEESEHLGLAADQAV